MLRDLPTPAELSAVRRHLERYNMTLVHQSIFRRAIQLAFHKTVRPPSKKHLGTNLLKINPLPCIPEIFHELTSTARGLPETSPLEGIERPTAHRAIPSASRSTACCQRRRAACGSSTGRSCSGRTQ